MFRVTTIRFVLALFAAAGVARSSVGQAGYEDRYADGDSVRIHYVVGGSGPMVLFVHGFPDFWYTWRDQMDALRDAYRVVAMDTRGYNLSGQPETQADYALGHLMRDLAAVIQAEGSRKATIVGHDWGAYVAWYFAMQVPQMTEGLVVVGMPHPRALYRELATNREQQLHARYARNFQLPDSDERLTADVLAGMVAHGPAERARYVAAFERSSIDGMMDYFRQNFPRPPYRVDLSELPVIAAPVLQIHGLQDEYFLPDGLDGTWKWVGKDYTLLTIPDAGHRAHRDASDLVSKTIRSWLDAHR